MKKLFFVIALLSAISAWAAETKVENYRGALLGEAREVEGIGKEYVKSVCLEGNTLYCGAGHSVYALDATNAQSPQLLSSYEIYGYVRQIVVQGNYLYAACRESGVWILDVSDPRNLKLVSRYDPVELATGIDVAGEVMFLACRQNGVEMVDVSDPSTPTHIRLEKTSESQSIFYCDGILYSGEWADSWVTAIDASDMSAVKTLGTSPLQGFGDGVWTSGKYLYASTGHHSVSGKASKAGDGHGLEIFDISDKAKPRHLARVDFAKMYSSYPDYWTVRPASNGNYLVCADSFNGLYVVDAHRPAQPFIASRLTATDSEGKALPVTSVAVGKGVIYATVHQELGLLAIPCPKIKPVLRQRGKLPVNAAYRYPYETSEDSHFASWKPSGCFPVRGVAAKDSLVFAACTYGGLAILKADEAGRLVQIGKGPMAYASDVAICGDRLVVAEGFGGVATYHIRRDAAGTGIRLEESDRFDQFNFDGPHGLCFWVFAPDSRHIVAATRYHGYYYFTQKLEYLGQAGRGPGWDKYVPDAADSEGWYPRIQHNAGVFWVNVNDVTAGEKKDAGFKPTLFDGVCAYKDDRFITCTKGKMYVYSHAEAGEPRTGVGENLYGAPAWDRGARLGLTARIARQISMVDISNEQTPEVLWTESCDGFPEMATFWKGRFLVPCGYQGLLMEKEKSEPMASITENVLLLDSCVGTEQMPKTWQDGTLKTTKLKGWVSGFFPGTCWYAWQLGGDRSVRNAAERQTRKMMAPLSFISDHDAGFQIMCSLGLAYKLTGDAQYLPGIRTAAEFLASRYSPVTGTIKSWDDKHFSYPVIIDNMMNLELLTYAAELFCVPRWKEIAISHADVTLKNHFRQDGSSYHLVDYDSKTGRVLKKQTVQGFADESAWSRGQSWGLYGYTMMYRETGEERYLEHAQKIAAYLLPLLADNPVPKWDFMAPQKQVDVSAAAVMASAFVELSSLTRNKGLSRTYMRQAEAILSALSSPEYLCTAGEAGGFLLKHGTGFYKNDIEVDAPLSYADYYFLEALYRFRNNVGCAPAFAQEDYKIARTYHCGEDAQGVAVDESGFYFISNRSVSKYTLQGELLATWKEDTPELIQHFDGGIVIDGLLYCSHSNYPEVPMASSIEVFDPENLTHLKTISLGIDSGSCTWVVRGDDCWYVGFAHYDSKTGIIKDELDKDNRWTQIVRYDDQWHRTAGWILPKDLLAELHPYSLSGALYLNGKFYCTGHNEQKLYMLEFPPHGMTMQWTGTMDIPFKGQGIAIDREGNLWGVDRENGTVMMAKMEIKLGE